jgi:hypothetical protein
LESTGSQKEGKAKATLERTVLEEAGKYGITWSEVKSLAGNRVRWSSTNALRSQMNEIIYY